MCILVFCSSVTLSSPEQRMPGGGVLVYNENELTQRQQQQTKSLCTNAILFVLVLSCVSGCPRFIFLFALLSSLPVHIRLVLEYV